MILSQTCNYGIRAAIYIASQKQADDFVPIRKISRDLKLSFHFLTKILQILTREGILVSSRGIKGGVRLARPAEEISVLDIILAIDGPRLFQECILGLDHCGDENPCPLHAKWVELRPRLEEAFRSHSLAGLASGVAADIFRLTDLDHGAGHSEKRRRK